MLLLTGGGSQIQGSKVSDEGVPVMLLHSLQKVCGLYLPQCASATFSRSLFAQAGSLDWKNITVSVLISIPKRHQAVALAVDRGKLCVITSHSNFASRSTARRCDEQILKKNRNDSHRTSFAPCCIFLCSKIFTVIPFFLFLPEFLSLQLGIPISCRLSFHFVTIRSPQSTL